MAKTITETRLLQDVLEELKLLRAEISLFLPGEELEGYAHPKKITASYRKALSKYPLASAWK